MNVEDMQYGYCFHVYLRKYCDTKSSVLLWNMINVLIDTDGMVGRDDRVWSNFCQWCDRKWKEDPSQKFYDVALAWIETSKHAGEPNANPRTGPAYMFTAALEMACEETREDLNVSCDHDLKD